MNITQRQLRFFVTTADLGHITRASEALHISQPALTRALAAFEAQIGTPLFARTTRRLALSPEGARFLPLARRLLQDLDEAMDVLHARSRALQGRISLAVGSAFGCTVLPGVLAAFARQHPRVRVTVVESYGEGITRMVRTGEVDLGIGTPIGDIESLHCRCLLMAPLGVVFNADHHPVARGSAQELARLPVLKEGADSGVMDLLRIHGSPIVSLMSQGIEITSLTMQLALVQAGVGVAVLSALGASHPQARGLGFTLLQPSIVREVFLMRRLARTPHSALEAFSNVLVQHMDLQGLRPQVARAPDG